MFVGALGLTGREAWFENHGNHRSHPPHHDCGGTVKKKDRAVNERWEKQKAPIPLVTISKSPPLLSASPVFGPERPPFPDGTDAGANDSPSIEDTPPQRLSGQPESRLPFRKHRSLVQVIHARATLRGKNLPEGAWWQGKDRPSTAGAGLRLAQRNRRY